MNNHFHHRSMDYSLYLYEATLNVEIMGLYGISDTRISSLPYSPEFSKYLVVDLPLQGVLVFDCVISNSGQEERICNFLALWRKRGRSPRECTRFFKVAFGDIALRVRVVSCYHTMILL